MDKTLVIVESPAKANTISRYLGNNYTVAASVGHIRDLPASTLGVDVKMILNLATLPCVVRRALSEI